jgi:hypothetical protein
MVYTPLFVHAVALHGHWRWGPGTGQQDALSVPYLPWTTPRLPSVPTVCLGSASYIPLRRTGFHVFQSCPITNAIATDNAGANPHLIHPSTIEAVVAKYPRKSWTSCFAACMTKEMDLKPWCRTTAQENFVDDIMGNKLMEPYDG